MVSRGAGESFQGDRLTAEAQAPSRQRWKMRIVQKLGAGISMVGFLLIMVGGMAVRGDPDGTWVQVNLVHVAGGLSLFLGTVLSVVAAYARGGSNANIESRPGK